MRKLFGFLVLFIAATGCSDDDGNSIAATDTVTVTVTKNDTIYTSSVSDTVTTNDTIYTSSVSDTVINNYSESKVTGDVSFYITEKKSAAAVIAATVSAIGNSTATGATDSTGYIEFADMIISNYYFLVAKTGYASIIVPIDVDDNGSEVPRVQNIQKNIELPQLGVTVQGVVYYTNKDGQRIVVNGAAVELEITSSPNIGEFQTKVFSATTDSIGVYSFTNLPEGENYAVTVSQITVDGSIYSTSATRTTGGISVGSSKQLDEFVLDIQATEFKIDVTNKDNLTNAEALYFDFSKVVDVTKIKLDDIIVRNADIEVAISAAWSNGNKRISITSISGIWEDGASYSISLELKDVDGQSLSNTLSFNPASGEQLPTQVSAVSIETSYESNKANSSTSTITLKWNEVATASMYKIFRMTNDEDVYTYIGKTSASDDTTFITKTEDLFADGNSAIYKVVAANSLGMVDASTAPSITVRDEIAPGLTSATATEMTEDVAQANADAAPKKIGTSSFTFDEPMDTNIVPTAAIDLTASPINEGGYTFGWKWNSETTGTLSAYLATGITKADSVVFNVVVPTTNLKDNAGNVLGINSNVSRLTQPFFWKE